MGEQKSPRNGVVWILRAFAVIQFLVVLVALTNLDLGKIGQFEFVFFSAVLLMLFWATAAIVQELRSIGFTDAGDE